MKTVVTGVEVLGEVSAEQAEVLSPGALAFIATLERRFRSRRARVLRRRKAHQRRIDAGRMLDFLPQTASVRGGGWKVRRAPSDLQDRRVEITGPVDRKMVINALNAGTDVFMADFEDSNSPTWQNCLNGQVNLRDAVRGDISYDDPRSGKHYSLGDKVATLIVRPRGWHLEEAHLRIDGQAATAGIVDFALYLFHNHRELTAAGSGPYFYLPKLESHYEARLWNQIFVHAQALLGVPVGTIKATVLIETITAAFEMDEILYELRDHAVGLNCGRWDYIFSFIKRFQKHPQFVMPDRGLVGMTCHFLRSYSQLLIQTCHKRGAHAMGGMAAQIPIKDDSDRNEDAMRKVRADKQREAMDGHDGTWVAHPGLVEIARAEFADYGPNQLQNLREDVQVTASDLLTVPEGPRTEEGLRANIRIGVLYLEAWLRGNGCVPINNLMEDAATAEISRAQVWQWLHHRVVLEDGRRVDAALVDGVVAEEMEGLRQSVGDKAYSNGRFGLAADLFVSLIHTPDLEEFLTLPAYQHITELTRRATTVTGEMEKNGKGSDWNSKRFDGVKRDYTAEDVKKLSGSVRIEYTLAERGARKLWDMLHTEDFVPALGAVTGNQAMQMVRAGLKAIYLSGWQVAADANLACSMYPDQSLYPANSAPTLCKRINAALQRADQVEHMEGQDRDWFAPIVADAEAGFGGPLNAFELMKSMIEAGAAGVHFEDQLASEKKCGHMGGKVLVPTQTFVRTLNAARLATDVMGVSTMVVARTDANAATLLTSDVDERDHKFLTGERTPEGFFGVKAGLDQAIARGLAYAPYADMVWCETAEPSIEEAKRFAEAMKAQFPNKLLAYNCSPSFNWAKKLDAASIAKFQRELGAMGYKFQFVTLAGFHSLNHGMFELALDYKDRGMAAYSELQQSEFGSEKDGYTATRHQREVGTGYFDAVSNAVAGGKSSTTALTGSTEEEQFNDDKQPV